MMFTSMGSYAGQELCPRCGEDEAGDSWPCCSDGHPHAETCAKKTYREYVCDRCERELNTQLPTSGVLSGESKWEVRRRSRNGKGHEWRVYRPDGKRDGRFRTWRKAMQHLDKRTTTTVRVPQLRLDETGSVNFPSGSGVTMNDYLHTSVLYGDCQVIHGDAVLTGEAVIPRRDWKPLALALLALHYQQEVVE